MPCNFFFTALIFFSAIALYQTGMAGTKGAKKQKVVFLLFFVLFF